MSGDVYAPNPRRGAGRSKSDATPRRNGNLSADEELLQAFEVERLLGQQREQQDDPTTDRAVRKMNRLLVPLFFTMVSFTPRALFRL